jgi:hypothetical protein
MCSLDFVHAKGFLRALENGGDASKQHLLKQVRPAYGEGKLETTLSTNVANRKINPKAGVLLAKQGLQLENIIHREGPVRTDTLLKRIAGLRKLVDKYKNLDATNWITQTFGRRFVVEDGVVRLKPREAPAPPAPPAPEKDMGQKAGFASMDFFARKQAERLAKKK